MTEQAKDKLTNLGVVATICVALGVIIGSVGGKLIYDKLQMVDRHEVEIREMRIEMSAFEESLRRIERAVDNSTKATNRLGDLVSRLEERIR